MPVCCTRAHVQKSGKRRLSRQAGKLGLQTRRRRNTCADLCSTGRRTILKQEIVAALPAVNGPNQPLAQHAARKVRVQHLLEIFGSIRADLSAQDLGPARVVVHKSSEIVNLLSGTKLKRATYERERVEHLSVNDDPRRFVVIVCLKLLPCHGLRRACDGEREDAAQPEDRELHVPFEAETERLLLRPMQSSLAGLHRTLSQ